MTLGCPRDPYRDPAKPPQYFSRVDSAATRTAHEGHCCLAADTPEANQT